jgi:hypothetical protein
MDKPSPGSKEAVEQGCTCPVMDNGHGWGIPDMKGEIMFWINEDCPLHGEKHG